MARTVNNFKLRAMLEQASKDSEGTVSKSERLSEWRGVSRMQQWRLKEAVTPFIHSHPSWVFPLRLSQSYLRKNDTTLS